MTTPRPHPFDLVFADLAAERFPAIGEALGRERSVSQFLMTPVVVELLHELRPDDGLGDAVDDFVAFVHAAFWYWRDGQRTVVLDEAATRDLGRPHPERSEGSLGSPRSDEVPRFARDEACYTQIAPRILWSRLDSADIHEPIDGWFALPEGEVLRVVACLGVHPERPGLSVLTAVGAPPSELSRDDGSAPFAPIMEGGLEAGLHSVASAEELLWLAWKADERRGASGET